jgi:hypothetical protein
MKLRGQGRTRPLRRSITSALALSGGGGGAVYRLAADEAGESPMEGR